MNASLYSRFLHFTKQEQTLYPGEPNNRNFRYVNRDFWDRSGKFWKLWWFIVSNPSPPPPPPPPPGLLLPTYSSLGGPVAPNATLSSKGEKKEYVLAEVDCYIWVAKTMRASGGSAAPAEPPPGAKVAKLAKLAKVTCLVKEQNVYVISTSFLECRDVLPNISGVHTRTLNFGVI